MKRMLLVGLASVILLSDLSACATTVTQVVIKSYVVSNPEIGGPYTLTVDAYDNTDGKVLHHDEQPVVGEYGPSALLYPSGHRVDVSVRIRLGGGKKIPTSSYIRLRDVGAKEKSCSPVDAQRSSLECKISTRF